MMDLHLMAAAAREAAWKLSTADAAQRDAAIRRMADALSAHWEDIRSANEADLQLAEQEQLEKPLLDRLRFDQSKLAQLCNGLEALSALPDPIGRTTLSRELMPGLNLYRVSCPIGVIGVIFESRPDALVQIASLCLKSGNAVLLKGGREAARTNAVLTRILRSAVQDGGLPADFAQLLESREDVAAMLKEDELIDLVIPRGSKAFVRYVMDHSRIPVLGHADGLCHVYVDQAANPETAVRIVADSKAQNVSVCNAAETLLIHQDAAAALLPEIAAALRTRGIRILGDEEAVRLTGCEAATEEDWRTEYLDRILSIRIVPSLEAAIAHINRYGSHHTDCIVTEDQEAAARFLREVDSAGVYVNVSTRFADGFAYGFGAEVGIATGRIHARGPMGLEGLTTYKYKLLGSGQIMADVKSGKLSYTHRDLQEDCPL